MDTQNEIPAKSRYIASHAHRPIRPVAIRLQTFNSGRPAIRPPRKTEYPHYRQPAFAAKRCAPHLTRRANWLILTHRH